MIHCLSKENPPLADLTQNIIWENVITWRAGKMVERFSKGAPSWHTLLPWRSTRGTQRLEVPVEHVGLLSYLTYFWMDGFMWRAFRAGVNRANLWTCPAVDTAEQNAERYNQLWIIEGSCCGCTFWPILRNQQMMLIFDRHQWVQRNCFWTKAMEFASVKYWYVTIY